MYFIGGIVNILRNMLQKKILSIKKLECSKKAPLWLSPLSLLAHLIMIAPFRKLNLSPKLTSFIF
jgi:hypothetical protein